MWGLIFWQSLFLAGVVSFISTWLVVRWGKRLGIIDDPASHKHPKVVHVNPVPRGGGIPIGLALALVAPIFLAANYKVWGIVVGAGILVVTGYVDDKYEELVSPYLRLVMNILAALAVIGVGIGIAYITNPGGGLWRLDWPKMCFTLGERQHCVWILSDVFALVWLVWIQNVVGWSSGVDGQLPGFVVVAAATLSAMGMRFGSGQDQMLLLGLGGIIVGAYLGFLPWNWFPQKIIPGYGGKSLAGYLLGVLAIVSGAKVGALALVLGIPFIDAVLVIIKRLAEGRSPVWGGREHLHHYLLEMGWSKRRIALFYWGAAVVLGYLALRLNSGSKYFTMAAILLLVGGFIVWLHYFSTYLKQRDQDSG